VRRAEAGIRSEGRVDGIDQPPAQIVRVHPRGSVA
jgi:hypothetical protein